MELKDELKFEMKINLLIEETPLFLQTNKLDNEGVKLIIISVLKNTVFLSYGYADSIHYLFCVNNVDSKPWG